MTALESPEVYAHAVHVFWTESPVVLKKSVLQFVSYKAYLFSIYCLSEQSTLSLLSTYIMGYKTDQYIIDHRHLLTA